MPGDIILAPSILSADFSCLGEQLETLEQGGADWIHVDVMDGHFVPNLSFGPFILSVIRKHTRLPIDVHLMVQNPDTLIQEFIERGANQITVHAESCPHLYRTLQQIKAENCKVGVALNPATSIEVLAEVAHLLDQVLVLGNNPGFSGQGWFPEMGHKVARTARLLQELGSDAILQVDGGMDAKTLPEAYKAGARAFVSGSAIFNHPGGILEGIYFLNKSLY